MSGRCSFTVPQIMDITSLFNNSGLIDTQLHSFLPSSKTAYTLHKIIKSPFRFIIHVKRNVRNELIIKGSRKKSKYLKTKLKYKLAGAVVEGSLANVPSGC